MFDCPVEHNGASAFRSTMQLPGLLEALADCDVPADRLTAADFKVQPRETAHEPLLPPGQEDDSWDEQAGYDPDE